MTTASGWRGVLARRWRWAMWGAIGALLFAPLIAMRFTREVAWTASDFAFAALLLGGAGLALEFAVRMIAKPGLRLAAGAAILVVVGLVWAQGAVGII